MNRRLIVLLAMMLGAFVWGTEMRAQSSGGPSLCGCPPGSQEVTGPIQICLGGANFTVEVTYCNRRFIPFEMYLCAIRPIDMYTTIKKVCYPPPGFTDEQIVNAIHCAMDPAKGNFFNTQASHFTTYSWGSLFCWVIAKPRCLRRDSSDCIIACNSNCCAVWEEYTLDGAGNIIYLEDQDTPDCFAGTCPTQGGCTTITCERPNCDCP
jgi:hypothetical protein